MRAIPALLIVIVASACSRDANRDVRAAQKSTPDAGAATTTNPPTESPDAPLQDPSARPEAPPPTPASPANPPAQPQDTTDASGQSNAPSDLDLLQKVRLAIANEASLSNTAKAVSVITRSGRVTLRGNVTSDTEKERLLDLAREAAGQDSVDDELEVQPQ